MSTTPTLTTTVASPNVTLSNAAVTLKDSATLSGGANPAGTITFQLVSPQHTILFTDTEAVNGNGTYNTPNGYALPTNGTAEVGTYSWQATYSGDANNSSVSASAEQTTISAASPGLSTTASAGGLAGTVLKDTANLSGGYFPRGTITFQLFSPQHTILFNHAEAVNGNGTYSTSTGYTVPNGAAAGTYSWAAIYSGDLNNDIVTAAAESVIVGPQVDLSVTITGRAAVAAGTTDTYTIAVLNNGPSTVSSLGLTDAIPAALLGASFMPSVGAYDPGTGIWSGLSLASGQIVHITLSGLIDPNATGTLTDSVTVSPNGVPENNPANNVSTVSQSLTAFIPNPSPPSGTSANMITSQASTGNYEIYDLGTNAVLAAHSLVQIGSPWQPVYVGGFDGSDTSDLLLRNGSTGAFDLLDVAGNNANDLAQLGAVGTDWSVLGFGDFSGNPGETDMMMRQNGTAALETYDISNNRITGAAAMGAVGPEWQFLGAGDFSSNTNESDMLMRDVNNGALEVYNINHNAIVGSTGMGAIGLEWQFVGVGDFSGNAGEIDMLMRDVNDGALEVYNVHNDQIVSAQGMGAVGLEWSLVGIGDFSGNPGETDMIMRDANNGAFEIYDINHDSVVSALPIGAVGTDWQTVGIAPYQSAGTMTAASGNLDSVATSDLQPIFGVLPGAAPNLTMPMNAGPGAQISLPTFAAGEAAQIMAANLFHA